MADVLGAAGMILLLGAFVANATARLSANSIAYHALNAVGAGLLAWYSVYLQVWVFAVLESVWMLAALWNLGRATMHRRRR